MAGGGAKAQIKKALRGLGFELQKLNPDGTFAKRRQRLLKSKQIDLVIDVGAHAGEFGQALRHGGYTGQILSFEPVDEHYESLQALATADGHWACSRTAIGDHPGVVEINVSGNDGYSSSVREMTKRHEASDPESAYIRSEQVEMLTLDEAGLTKAGGERPFLKVDTQGYEEGVLAGGSEVLGRCQIAELELSFAELYAGQALFAELVERIRGTGMVLVDLEPGFRDGATGELLQVDALFVRPS